MGREIDLILNIVPELKSMSCDPYEFIYFEDDFAEQIFFVNEGFLSLKTKNGNTFMSFTSGDMIGDVEIIFNVKTCILNLNKKTIIIFIYNFF